MNGRTWCELGLNYNYSKVRQEIGKACSSNDKYVGTYNSR